MLWYKYQIGSVQVSLLVNLPKESIRSCGEVFFTEVSEGFSRVVSLIKISMVLIDVTYRSVKRIMDRRVTVRVPEGS